MCTNTQYIRLGWRWRDQSGQVGCRLRTSGGDSASRPPCRVGLSPIGNWTVGKRLRGVHSFGLKTRATVPSRRLKCKLDDPARVSSFTAACLLERVSSGFQPCDFHGRSRDSRRHRRDGNARREYVSSSPCDRSSRCKADTRVADVLPPDRAVHMSWDREGREGNRGVPPPTIGPRYNDFETRVSDPPLTGARVSFF